MGVGVFGIYGYFFGLILFLFALRQFWLHWQDPEKDESLSQIALAGNLLVRTSRDQRKQIWYRQEILEYAIEEEMEEHTTSGEGSTSTTIILHLTLYAKLHNGEKAMLIRRSTSPPWFDYRVKAELEWITTHLQNERRLDDGGDGPEVLPTIIPEEHITKIEDRNGYREPIGRQAPSL